MIRRFLIVSLVLIWSLGWLRPAGAASEVEVLFVVDTSDTMAAELDVLCAELDGLMGDWANVDYVVLGITQERNCTTGTVVDLVPEGRVSDAEDWGLAVADLAEGYNWGSGTARLIIPLSDEGPYHGDPVDDPGEDREAVETAVRLAKENDVIVSPVLGNDTRPEVEKLARYLADQTGGQLFVTEQPMDDLTDGVERLIDAVAERIQSQASLVERLPTFREVSWQGSVLSANLALAVLLTLLLGVSTFVLTSSIADNREVFSQSYPGRLSAAARSLGDVAGRALTPGEWRGVSPRLRQFLSGTEIALFLLLTGLMGAFLQPGFRLLSFSGLGLFVGLTLAVVAVGLVYEGARRLVARRLGLALDVQLRPASLLVTLVCVILSRLLGFRPGFFYGRPMSYEIAELQPEAAKRQRLVLFGLGATWGAGLLAWGLAWLASSIIDLIEKLELAGGLEKVLTGGIGLFEGLFLFLFFVAWQMVFFELLPFEVTGGGELYHRRPLLWSLSFAGVSFLLLHTLVNPAGAVLNLGQSHGLTLWLVALFAYSTFAIGVWLYFALLTGGETGTSYNRGQVSTVLAISLAIIWILFCLLVVVGAVVRSVR